MRDRRPPVLSFMFTILMYAGNALSSPATSTVVYPTGVFPDDVVAVQQAVDGGGTVVLESVNNAGEPTAFNFGPPASFARVYLTVNVEILGVEGSATTRIEGGYIPFFGVEHATTRIENITFDSPALSAAIFIYSTGVQFVGNHVTGVVGYLLIFPPLTEGRGIKFLGNNDPAGAIVGDIEIVGNRFDNMHADLSDAIVFDSVAADAYIAYNEVHDTGGAGVLAIAHSGDMEITRNTIIPGPGTTPGSFGDGILLVGGTGRYTVTRNTIRCENFLAEPILLIGDDAFAPIGRIDAAVISQNSITRVGPGIGGGISLWGDVDNTYVNANRLTGSSAYAFGVVPLFGGESAIGNTFVGNNITRYDADFVQTVVWSHAIDTHVIGNAGSVYDIGQNTVITGEGPVAGGFAGGLGQANQAAILERVSQLLDGHRP